MELKWKHECDKIVKRIKKKTGPANLHMKRTKQAETQTLQSLIFVSPPYTETQFPLLQICSECDPNGTQRPSKLRPAGAFGAKKLAGKRFQKNAENKSPNKLAEGADMRSKRKACKVVVWILFRIWGQRRPRVIPRTPPGTLQLQSHTPVLSKHSILDARVAHFLPKYIPGRAP